MWFLGANVVCCCLSLTFTHICKINIRESNAVILYTIVKHSKSSEVALSDEPLQNHVVHPG